jgi:hypothetical protein
MSFLLTWLHSHLAYIKLNLVCNEHAMPRLGSGPGWQQHHHHAVCAVSCVMHELCGIRMLCSVSLFDVHEFAACVH